MFKIKIILKKVASSFFFFFCVRMMVMQSDLQSCRPDEVHCLHGIPTACPGALHPVARIGDAEHCGLGNFGGYVQGSRFQSHIDTGQCGKSLVDVGGLAVCSVLS